MIGTDVRSVGANATSPNVLAGKAMEFLNEDSKITLYATGAAAAMHATLMIGDSVLIDDQEISGANRFPLRPDDMVDEGAGFAGDRLILRIRNSTGGALVAQSLLVVEPL